MTLTVLMCISGILLLLCVFANRISDNFGIPALLLFLALGMLAGSDGPGGIQFYDAKLSNYIGTIALSMILFSGGLETLWSEVKNVAARGSVLSTLGVFLTALFMYISTYYILGLSFEVSLLLSVIVSSTDAPAVFAIMRSHKAELKSGLKPILEFESGSNDPMAVLLSMGAITYLSQPEFNLPDILQSFFRQMSLGLLIGFLLGRLAGYTLKRWSLSYAGLYPVFGVGLVLTTFGIAELLGGNGFLAVYLCGIFLGNTVFLHRRQMIRFHDSLAWIAQIGMFLILGLLVNPHELGEVTWIGLGCAVFLMFVARPLAVFACLARSKFDTKEKFFISWAGLKGAVPIILATYPMMIQFPNSQFLFNLIFFLVIISVLFQGKTLAPLAKWLKLDKKD